MFILKEAMTVTIELSPEREAQLRDFAESNQMSIEEVLLKGSEQLVPSESISHLQITDPEEWARRFHAWAESHDRTTPLLSDEDISRDRIYSDRGL